MIREHDRVVLVTAVPTEGLVAGDVGTVVHIYRDGQAYEVEFTTLEGKTAAVVTLEASQVRPVGKREITHARELASREPTAKRRAPPLPPASFFRSSDGRSTLRPYIGFKPARLLRGAPRSDRKRTGWMAIRRGIGRVRLMASRLLAPVSQAAARFRDKPS